MSSSSGDVNEVFPHKACINLDRDLDSWGRLQAALTRHDIRGVRRVSAVDGSRLELPATWRHSAGAYGCLLSHLQVVRDARKRGLPSLLILEDDVVFDPSFSEKFPVFVRGLPADWDMVFLGALHREDPVPVAENVVRIRHAYSTYAYALRDSIFDAFIAANDGSPNQVDVNNGMLQSNHNCYGFAPNLAWVESRYSPVQERMADHWYLRESVVLLGSQMDRILRAYGCHHRPSSPERECHQGAECGIPVALLCRVPTRNQDLRCRARRSRYAGTFGSPRRMFLSPRAG